MRSFVLGIAASASIAASAEFSDLGSGKCLVEGREPAYSYHGGMGASSCQASCAESARCYGYSASTASNCVQWEEPGLTAGGAAWGGAHCVAKGPPPPPTPTPPPPPPTPLPPPPPPTPPGARQVVICSGLMDMDQSALDSFASNCAEYQGKGMITHVSPLLYGISDSGAFVTSKYGTPKDLAGVDYTHQRLGKAGLGLGVLPTVFCDGTQPNTCNMPTALNAAEKNPEPLFNASVTEALKYGWEGYMIDLEGGGGSYTTLMEQWGDYLHQHGLKLYLWNTMISISAAGSSASIDGVVSMNTYGGGFSSFKSSASSFLKSVPASKAGFGLITYSSPNSGVDEIGPWCAEQGVTQIAIWSNQQIPSSWNTGLQKFLGNAAVTV